MTIDAPHLLLVSEALPSVGAPDNRDRVLFDGKPARIVGWWADRQSAGVDLTLDDGGQRWCYWPSPRITSMPEGAC